MMHPGFYKGGASGQGTYLSLLPIRRVPFRRMSSENQGLVSVIIPARNEAANIARAVRSLAPQWGVGDIVVVDDQSEDRTGEVLETLKVEIPNLRVLKVESLPAGWLGKPHALALGAQTAAGEWLLFTDADTEHRPGSLAVLLGRAELERIDLLSVSPGQKVQAWWEKALIPLVYTRLARLYRFEEVSDPHSPRAAANGQYVLIRREVYERVGGHGAIREEILEDLELARRVKAAGGRLLFLPGAMWVETRMYHAFHEMWEGWTKNLFLLYDGSPGKILLAVAETALADIALPALFLGSCVALVLADGSGTVAGAAIALLLAAWARRRRYSWRLERLGYDRRLAGYLPAGGVLLGLLLLNSLWTHAWSGTVRWKGRSYSTRKILKGKP